MAVKDCVFSKTNVIITFSAKLPFVWVKNADLLTKFFCENLLRIITSHPGYGLFTWTVILTVLDATAASDTAQK
jgi:hypothetical protein